MNFARSVLAVTILFGSSVALLSAEELTLAAGDSSIDFVGSKADGKHKGGFNKFKIDADANWEDPSKSSISVEIDAKSIWSDNDKLTNHLKSPDFFDVRNNPTITFESTKVEPGGRDGDKVTGKISGKWTMIGKTVEVEVPISAVVTEDSVEMEADFSIDRTKWGMTYGQGKIDNDVKVKVKFMFKR